jgi:hypothetical protein
MSKEILRPQKAQPVPVPLAHIVGEIDHMGKVWTPAEQKPVAWAMFRRGRLDSFWMNKGDAYDYEFTSEHEWKPLYTTPPAAQRPWVGLTDEDMGFLFPHGKSEWVQETVKIIEAKLRSKNT